MGSGDTGYICAKNFPYVTDCCLSDTSGDGTYVFAEAMAARGWLFFSPT